MVVEDIFYDIFLHFGVNTVNKSLSSNVNHLLAGGAHEISSIFMFLKKQQNFQMSSAANFMWHSLKG